MKSLNPAKALLLASSLAILAPASNAVSVESSTRIETATPSIFSPYQDDIVAPGYVEFAGSAPQAWAYGDWLADGYIDYQSYDDGERHEWIIFERDDNLILLGGKESNFHDVGSAAETFSIEPPIEFSIDGKAIDQISIESRGYVALYSLTDGIMGAAIVAPDLIGYRTHSNDYNLISVRTVGTDILITFEFESYENNTTNWNTTAQVVIDTVTPSIGFKLDKTNFNDPLFDLENGQLGCGITVNDIYEPTIFNPAEMKLSAAERIANNDNTSMVCTIVDGSEDIQLYVTPQPTDPLLPEFIFGEGTSDFLSEAAGEPNIVRVGELLPSTEYTAMLRHHVRGVWGTGISSWSEPVDFKTADGSEFSVAFSGEGFTSEQQTYTFDSTGEHTITVTLTNDGTTAGNPIVALGNYSGSGQLPSFSDALQLGTCDENTDYGLFSCVTPFIVNVDGTVTFDLNINVKSKGSMQLGLSACSESRREAGLCSETIFTVQVKSGDDSGGGSAFWFLLLSLPLTLLRRSR